MPNYYAHYIFGQKVFAVLPPLLRGTLERELSAFEVGLYGPDPLFFASPVTDPGPRNLAINMHGESLLPVAKRLMGAVRDDLPFARGYAAGFLCHFALDSRCHYYIEEQQALSGLSHTAMEMELDRALILADGMDPLHETPLEAPELPAGFLDAASVVYPGVSRQQFVRGYWNFRQLCRMKTLLSGTPAYRATDWVGSRYPLLAIMKGSILPPEPDPLYAQSTADMKSLLEGEVAPTAQAVSRFFAAAARNGQLDGWFDRPFSGQWIAEQAMSVQAGGR